MGCSRHIIGNTLYGNDKIIIIIIIIIVTTVLILMLQRGLMTGLKIVLAEKRKVKHCN
jgi:hypothetical protein